MKFQVLEDILIEYFFLISEKFRFILLFIHLFMIVKSRNKKKFIVLSAQRSERQKILPLHFFSIFVCRIIRLRQTIKKKKTEEAASSYWNKNTITLFYCKCLCFAFTRLKYSLGVLWLKTKYNRNPNSFVISYFPVNKSQEKDFLFLIWSM